MLRIITTNVNGIRAAERKGFFDWLKTQDADIVCLQEIKAQEDQLDDKLFITILLRKKAILELQFSRNKNQTSSKKVYGMISILKEDSFRQILKI
jgi:exonuclease III